MKARKEKPAPPQSAAARPRRLSRPALATLLLCALGGAAHAQDDYPKRPVTIVVGFSAGGITDIFARQIAFEAQKAWGANVIVDNRPGAAGLVASDYVARANPDGYTLLMTANNHTINAAIRPKAKIDAIDDFTAITLLASTPNVLLVPMSSPYKTVADYIAAARAKPGTISYGSSGMGTAPHFAGEQFASLIKTKFIHVPYRGSNQSLMAATTGEVDSTWSAAALQQVKGGKVRALGIASASRFALAPDIPTFAEQGIKGFQSEVWVGLLGPAKLPTAISAKWNGLVQKLLAQADVKEKIQTQGYEPIADVGLGAFRQKLQKEIQDFRKTAIEADIHPE